MNLRKLYKALGMLTTLIMLMALLTATALAVDVSATKTIDPIGANRYKITVTLPDAVVDKPVYDIVFVLDKNTNAANLVVDLSDWMSDMADDLTAAYGTDGQLNVGIVSFSSYTAVKGATAYADWAHTALISDVDDLDFRPYFESHALAEYDTAYETFLKTGLQTQWTNEYKYSDWSGKNIFRAFVEEDGLPNSVPVPPATPTPDDTSVPPRGIANVGGTNIQAGLRAANNMLAADTTTPASHKQIVLVTDGGSYLWLDANEEPSFKVSSGISASGHYYSAPGNPGNGDGGTGSTAGTGDGTAIAEQAILYKTYLQGTAADGSAKTGAAAAAAFAAFITNEGAAIEKPTSEKMSFREFYRLWETANAAFDAVRNGGGSSADASTAAYATFKRGSATDPYPTETGYKWKLDGTGANENMRWPFQQRWYYGTNFMSDYHYTQMETGLYYAAKELQASVDAGYSISTLGFTYQTSGFIFYNAETAAFLEWAGSFGDYNKMPVRMDAALTDKSAGGMYDQSLAFLKESIDARVFDSGDVIDKIGPQFTLDPFIPTNVAVTFNGSVLAGTQSGGAGADIEYAAGDFVLEYDDANKILTLHINIPLVATDALKLEYNITHTKLTTPGSHTDYTSVGTPHNGAYLEYIPANSPNGGNPLTYPLIRTYVQYSNSSGGSGGSGGEYPTPPVLPPRTGDAALAAYWLLLGALLPALILAAGKARRANASK
ncbi:MAG: hypothetical protein LBN26_05155 [Christensenellaceae bacterium]|nr:hypothetical protein [Christensenellaceae bacterium]